MASDDSNYKRAEDLEWRKSVESRLVSLTSAQKTTDDDLDKITTRLDEVDELLEGDPLKREDSGLKGDVKDLGRGLNELRAIMAPDHLGHGGVKHRLEAVESALGLRRESNEHKWKLILAVIGLTGVVTTAVVSNLDKIEKFVKNQFTTGPLEKKIDKSRGPKKRVTHVRYRVVPREEPSDRPQEEVPDGRGDDGSDTK